MKRYVLASVVIVMAACSLAPVPRATPAVYDLGTPRLAAFNHKAIPASLLMRNVTAPYWLDTSAIVYRLASSSDRQQAYANSQWAAPPAALLTQLLRDRLARVTAGGVSREEDGVRADYVVDVELEDFSQIFDTGRASRGIVVARASLINAQHRTLVNQKDFTFDQSAPTPDAQGGVRALTEAANNFTDAMVIWLTQSINAINP